MDIALIESLLSYICEEGAFQREGSTSSVSGGSVMGAVLVFLPGWDEIMRLKDRLEASHWFGGSRWGGRVGGVSGRWRVTAGWSWTLVQALVDVNASSSGCH